MKTKAREVYVRQPVDQVFGSLLVTSKASRWARRQCWSGYELMPTHMDFLPTGRVRSYEAILSDFFRQFADVPEGWLAMVPKPDSAAQRHDALAAAMTAKNNHLAAAYCQAAAEALRPLDEEDASPRFGFYLWLRLTPDDITLEGMVKTMLGRSTSARLIDRSVGNTISEKQILLWEQAEQQLRARINNFFGERGLAVKALTRDECLKQIRAPFYRCIAEPPLVPGWAPSAYVGRGGDGGLVLTPDDAMRRLYSGEICQDEGEGFIRTSQVVDGEKRSSYQAFLTIEQYAPNGTMIPGDEWSLQLQRFGPVEVHIRWTPVPYEQHLAAIESQKRKQTDTTIHETQFAGGQTMVTATSEVETAELEQYVRETRSPSLRVSVVVVVPAKTEKKLEERIKQVVGFFNGMDTKLAQNATDQVRHFYETIPGSPRLIDDYIHPMTPLTLSACMFGATVDVLDPSGVFIGTDAFGRTSYLDTRRALAKRDTAGNMAFWGPTGAGKSTTANQVLFVKVLFGGIGLAIDTLKNERGHWAETLPLLGPYTTVVTLSQHNKDRGTLDPFMIFPDRGEAANHAISQAAFLTQIKYGDIKWAVLQKAFLAVRDHGRVPCMMAGIHELQNLAADPTYDYRTEAAYLAERLRTTGSMAWANLLFGDGSGAHIDTSARLTVLQLDRVQRPPEGKKTEDYTMDEFLGTAIMTAGVAFANTWARGDRRTQKTLLADETRWLVASDYGRDLIAQQALGGRAMGTEVLLVGQNARHFPEDLRQHFTMRWAFGCDDEQEASESLALLGAPDTPANRQRLMRLNRGANQGEKIKGQALVRDLDGRIGEIWVHHLFDDLLTAFDTQSLKDDKEGLS